MRKPGHLPTLNLVLIPRIIVASTIITAIFTAISYYAEYEREVANLDSYLKQVESAQIPALSEAMWGFNTRIAQAHIDGLTNSESIVSATLHSEDNQLIYSSSSDSKETRFMFKKVYPLAYEGDEIGQLKVLATKAHIVDKLVDQFTVFVVLQFFRTIIIIGIIYYIFKFYVTRHLVKISQYLSGSFFREDKLALETEGSSKAYELDLLVGRLNDLISAANQREDELVRESESLKVDMIHAAKMASLGEMAGGVAHEINNPLYISTLNVGRIKRLSAKGDLNKVELGKSVSKIEESLYRIADIVKLLRDLSRDGLEDVEEKYSFQDIIEDVLNLCREKISMNSVSLSSEVNVKNSELLCKPVQISQALYNIINNAYEAAVKVEDKWVKIELEETDTSLILSISDSGAGIPKSIQNRIFNPFYSTKEIGEGPGVGLSISKNLIENNGGKLYFDESSSHTCFKIEFPKN